MLFCSICLYSFSPPPVWSSHRRSQYILFCLINVVFIPSILVRMVITVPVKYILFSLISLNLFSPPHLVVGQSVLIHIWSVRLIFMQSLHGQSQYNLFSPISLHSCSPSTLGHHTVSPNKFCSVKLIFMNSVLAQSVIAQSVHLVQFYQSPLGYLHQSQCMLFSSFKLHSFSHPAFLFIAYQPRNSSASTFTPFSFIACTFHHHTVNPNTFCPIHLVSIHTKAAVLALWPRHGLTQP